MNCGRVRPKLVINIESNSSSSAASDSKDFSLTNYKNDSTPFRIFISYSSKDIQIVEEIEK
jgi:hypothetical protein